VCHQQATRIFAEGNNLRCFKVSMWQRGRAGRPVARVLLHMAEELLRTSGWVLHPIC
jgi:hypothetical protein